LARLFPGSEPAIDLPRADTKQRGCRKYLLTSAVGAERWDTIR